MQKITKILFGLALLVHDIRAGCLHGAVPEAVPAVYGTTFAAPVAATTHIEAHVPQSIATFASAQPTVFKYASAYAPAPVIKYSYGPPVTTTTTTYAGFAAPPHAFAAATPTYAAAPSFLNKYAAHNFVPTSYASVPSFATPHFAPAPPHSYANYAAPSFTKFAGHAAYGAYAAPAQHPPLGAW